jgi:hypothetical protein
MESPSPTTRYGSAVGAALGLLAAADVVAAPVVVAAAGPPDAAAAEGMCRNTGLRENATAADPAAKVSSVATASSAALFLASGKR